MLLVCSSLIISLSHQHGNSVYIFLNEKWRNFIWPEAMEIEFTRWKIAAANLFVSCFSLIYLFTFFVYKSQLGIKMGV